MAYNQSACPSLDKPSAVAVVEIFEYISYFVITIICFFLANVGHVLSFLAFYKQWKTEAVYGYQVFESVGALLHTYSQTMIVVTEFWFADKESGTAALWFRRQYALMFYGARLATPINSMIMTYSYLVAVFMALDRLHALAKPFSYKNANHTSRMRWAVLFSVVMGVGTSLFDCFGKYVGMNERIGLYEIMVDQKYVSGILSRSLLWTRNCLHLLIWISLVISNTIVVRLFRARSKKVMDMAIYGNGNAEEKEKRSIEKTLIILSLCEAIQTLIEMTNSGIYATLSYSIDGFAHCGSIFYELYSVPVHTMVASMDFYVMIIVSKRFRRMIKDVLKSFRCCPSQNMVISQNVTLTVNRQH